MSKVTLTFTDGEEDGSVSLSVEFDPSLRRGEDPTPAQSSALTCVQFVNAFNNGSEAMDEFLEDLISDMQDDEDDDEEEGEDGDD